MKRKFCIICIMLLFNSGIAGNTFFLYTEEICDNKEVPLDESVREGILDEIYEAGYIIFDDASGQKYEIPALMSQVPNYGARYLVVAFINTQQSFTSNAKLEKLSCQARYALYDVKTRQLVAEAKLEKEEDLTQTPVSRIQFWFDLGIDIGKEIEKIYEKYNQ